MSFLMKISAFGLAAFFLIFAVPASAQDVQPMSAQDLVTLPRLGSATASADGRWAAYTVTTTDPETYQRRTEIRLRDLEGQTAEARSLPWQGDASGPAFGADGSLYFLGHAPQEGDEQGHTQLWKVTINDAGNFGQPLQVTDFAASIAGFELSRDGQRLVVWGAANRACTEFDCSDLPAPAPDPVAGSGRLYDTSVGFVRHWDQWETPGTYSRAFAYRLGPDGRIAGSGIPLDGPAGPDAFIGDTPTQPFGGGEEIAWAADSSAVYFASRKSDAMEPRSTNIDIFRSDLSTGTVENITDGNEATDTLPAPSPDGKWLAWAAMERPGYESDRLVVHLRDLATGETRALTQDWDRSAGSLTWTPDSRFLMATAQDVLDTPAFRIDPQTGAVERLDLVEGNEAHIGNVVPLAGDRLLFTRDAVAHPAELYLASASGEAERLTDIAYSRVAALGEVKTERFNFAGAGGDTVWGLIHKPAWTDEQLPAILYVHGGPQGTFNDSWSTRWNPRLVASQGYAVISVDFHGSTGYGQAFTDSINRDWGGKPLEDLQRGFAAAIADDPQIDGDRACAMGASYGGYMMNWIEGRWPDRFRCLVQHDGVFDARAMAFETEELWFDLWEHGGGFYFETPEEYERWNPVNHVSEWKTPMLVIAGEQDFRIPYTQGLAAFTALQMRGIPGQLLVFPDENHWVLKPRNSLQWHRTVFDWLERWLKE